LIGIPSEYVRPALKKLPYFAMSKLAFVKLKTRKGLELTVTLYVRLKDCEELYALPAALYSCEKLEEEVKAEDETDGTALLGYSLP
jgi:hypothetical protein